MTVVPTRELRASFARQLSQMYGREVPAYTTLVDVSTQVNQRVADASATSADRLGSIARVTAERHGAIRVGSPTELAQVARVFGAFGMYPVGFYDLREAAASAVPVVSTAFRPIATDELAWNPFRVFTSMLTVEDRRFFSPELSEQVTAFLDQRELFGAELLELADAASAAGGLDASAASRLLELATTAFELSGQPIDRAWYRRLEQVSPVAADIAGVDSTHINHLTPRVLDIDQLYDQMEQRGITMIDEIQGPPLWDGPDVLLRQTSFRALDEQRLFRDSDGSTATGALRVRFGEVESRGIALTPAGRDHYDALLTEVDRRLAADPSGPDAPPPAAASPIRALLTARQRTARQVWTEAMPSSEARLAAAGYGWFCYTVPSATEGASPPMVAPGEHQLSALVEHGVVVPQPIVYEDFLPRSAAGIFQSNLTSDGDHDRTQQGQTYDLASLSELIGRPIADPHALCAAQRQQSLDTVAQQLGIAIADQSSHVEEPTPGVHA